jgi:hypothetical protein
MLVEDGSLEHAVGDTGDEVLDVLQSDERGQGLLIGFVGCDPGEHKLLALFEGAAQGDFPHFATVGDSGVLQGRVDSNECCGVKRRGYLFGHGGILPVVCGYFSYCARGTGNYLRSGLSGLGARLPGQMQNEFVVEHDLLAFLDESVAACGSAAIGDVTSFAVEALRRVVSGMQANANPNG